MPTTITTDNALAALSLRVTFIDGNTVDFAATFQNAPDVTVTVP